MQTFVNEMTPTFLLGLVTLVLGGVIWLIRLEGRITLLFEKVITLNQNAEDKSKHTDRYLQSQFDAIISKINDLSRHFDKLENRFDTIIRDNSRKDKDDD